MIAIPERDEEHFHPYFTHEMGAKPQAADKIMMDVVVEIDPIAPLPTRFRVGWGAILLLILAGLLVVSHGCHGEEVDEELLAPSLAEPS